MCPHVNMGCFMLLKFKQKTSWCTTTPVENEKHMLSTKLCLFWKKGSCKTLCRNNAASLWSHDSVSIDLWIDYNCKRSSSSALPGLFTPSPQQLPFSGPLRVSRSLVVGSVLQRATHQSLNPCGLLEVLFCCCWGCLLEDEVREFTVREACHPATPQPLCPIFPLCFKLWIHTKSSCSCAET